MDSMYAKMVREKTDDFILETESGFATYKFTEYKNEKAVYIANIYVLPDFRKTNVAGAMADNIVEMARKKGCTKLLGGVVPSSKDSTVNLRVLLGYGMRLDSSAVDYIIFVKDI